jgi:hypothetical protein
VSDELKSDRKQLLGRRHDDSDDEL